MNSNLIEWLHIVKCSILILFDCLRSFLSVWLPIIIILTWWPIMEQLRVITFHFPTTGPVCSTHTTFKYFPWRQLDNKMTESLIIIKQKPTTKKTPRSNLLSRLELNKSCCITHQSTVCPEFCFKKWKFCKCLHPCRFNYKSPIMGRCPMFRVSASSLHLLMSQWGPHRILPAGGGDDFINPQIWSHCAGNVSKPATTHPFPWPHAAVHYWPL